MPTENDGARRNGTAKPSLDDPKTGVVVHSKESVQSSKCSIQTISIHDKADNPQSIEGKNTDQSVLAADQKDDQVVQFLDNEQENKAVQEDSGKFSDDAKGTETTVAKKLGSKKKLIEKKQKQSSKPGLAPAPSVNEATRYRTYNQVQDPMKNHEAYLKTHYDRLKRLHTVHKRGTVDCGTPTTYGKYRSRFDVVQHWADVNLNRANYRLFELFSTARSHYDHKAWIQSYERIRASMDHKIKNTKFHPRNLHTRKYRKPVKPSTTHIHLSQPVRHNGLN